LEVRSTELHILPVYSNVVVKEFMKSYESKQSLKLWFDMSCVPFPTAGSLSLQTHTHLPICWTPTRVTQNHVTIFGSNSNSSL